MYQKYNQVYVKLSVLKESIFGEKVNLNYGQLQTLQHT